MHSPELSPQVSQDLTEAGLPAWRGIFHLLRRHQRYVYVIVAVVFLVYYQATTFDFVTYDDYDLVSRNGNFLSSLSNLATSFTTHAFTTHREVGVYYRPLLLVSFIFDYHIWKLDAFGYHLTNILLHCGNAILCFALLLVLLRNDFVALMGSLLFALHPVQVEAVTWVSGRNDTLLCFFILLMVLSYVLYRQSTPSRIKYFVLSMISFALAIFTKEPAMFFLLILPLYDLCCTQPLKLRQRYSSRRFLFGLLVPVFISAIYLVIRLNVLGEFIGAEKLYGKTPLIERIYQIPAIVYANCSLILFPFRLSVHHSLLSFSSLGALWQIALIAISVLLLGIAWWACRRDRILFLGYSWFLVGLLPVLNVIPLAVPILEHRLYLPMAGVSLVVARASQMLMTGALRERAVKIMLIGLLVLCGCVSLLRLPVWRNSATLWSDAIEKEPNYSRPYFDLAGYYYELGSFDKAVDLINKYLELQSGDIVAYSKLRETYYRSGKYRESAAVSRKMISLEPQNPARYLEAGVLYARVDCPDSALELYQEGLRIDSNAYGLHYDLAMLYDGQGDKDHAEYHYRRAIELNPGSADAHFALGSLYARKGDAERAIQFIERGMSIGAPPKELVNALLALYVKTGRTGQAQQLAARYGLSY